MDQKDKFEEKILSLLDSLKIEIVNFRKDVNKRFGKVESRLDDVDNSLDQIKISNSGSGNKLDRIERRVERAIDRYDENFEEQAKRIKVLEGKK